MTNNQLRYAELVEQHRNNIVVSSETHRHNVTVETETARHNRADEDIRYQANAINAAHYANQDAAGFMQAHAALSQADAAQQNAATNYGNYINSAYHEEGQRQYWDNYIQNQQEKIKNDYRLGVQKNLVDATIGSWNARANLMNAQSNERNATTNEKNATTNRLNVGANYLRGVGSVVSGFSNLSKGINFGGTNTQSQDRKDSLQFWDDLNKELPEGE